MKVEIWSDIVCPFCYIGKRNLEKALRQTGMADTTDILWRSFELDPEVITNPGFSIYEHLAKRKGWTVEYSREMHGHVAKMAADAGLDYNFDHSFPANSFKAHRLLHHARKAGVQNEFKELLFKAHFTEGKNVDSDDILTELATEAGMEEKEIKNILSSGRYASDVKKDVARAVETGVRGVPYFVFNDHYAVAGAQPPDVLVRIIEEIKEENSASDGHLSNNGNTDYCEPEGNC
ncbi:MAG: DsbA family oxidoreductase [Balneolia bacterium]|nr:DsbA family oxidoreductase [Balneolia bacterium]